MLFYFYFHNRAHYLINWHLHGKYCKNRFCTLCCSIRKAEIINRYYPIIKQWKEPHFVSITIKAVKEDKLKIRIDGLLRGFKRINA